MTIGDKIKDEKSRRETYQFYHLKKLINANILQVKEYYLLIRDK